MRGDQCLVPFAGGPLQGGGPQSITSTALPTHSADTQILETRVPRLE